MNPVNRTNNLMTLLGWKGGTVHDACKEVGLDVNEFLYTSSDFDYNNLPCHDFRRGYGDAKNIALYLHENKGNLQYWFGAVSAVQNGAHKDKCECPDGPFHHPSCQKFDEEHNKMFAKLGAAMSKGKP